MRLRIVDKDPYNARVAGSVFEGVPGVSVTCGDVTEERPGGGVVVVWPGNTLGVMASGVDVAYSSGYGITQDALEEVLEPPVDTPYSAYVTDDIVYTAVYPVTLEAPYTCFKAVLTEVLSRGTHDTVVTPCIGTYRGCLCVLECIEGMRKAWVEVQGDCRLAL